MDITRRHAALLGLFALAGCATAVPIQTASVVPVGTVRVSGQSSLAIYCGFTSDLSRCAYGNGFPELRLTSRTGVHDRVDVGLAGQFYGGDAGLRWGLLTDAKVELWRSPIAEGRKQVLSAGLGVAVLGTQGDWARRGTVELDFVVPLRWGYQLTHTEIFLGAHFQERLVWGLLSQGGDAVAQVPAGGFSIGVVSRSRAKIGLALNYEAPLRWFDRGAITLGIGWLFDIDGSLREGRKGRRRGESGTTHAAPEEPPVLFTPDLTKD